MQSTPRRIGIVALITLMAATGIQVATAAPTFDAGTTIGVINQDNDYDSWISLDGQLIAIVHTVDTSAIVVVEVSQDGGATWETRSTGITGYGPRIAVRDNSHIVIVAGTVASGDTRAGKIIRTTTDAYTWTSSTVWPATTGGIQRLDIDLYGTRYVVGFEQCFVTVCGFSNSINPDYSWRWSASTDDGAVWTSAVVVESFDATINAGGAVHAWSGIAVAMQSATAWEIFYYKATSATPDWLIRRAATSNTGAAYTITNVNDQFAPLATINAGYGGDIQVSEDGNSISFKGNTAAAPTIYVGQNGAGDLWSFTVIDTSTLGFLSPVFTCASKAVAVFQGSSGDERLSYAEAVTGTAVITAITGATETVPRPYTAYLQGDNITVVYGNLADGKTIVRTTTNGDCAQVVTPVVVAGPDLEISPTQLMGFDVAPSSSSIITREGTVGPDNGRYVKLYNINSLGAGPTKDTDCNFDSGIAGASIIHSIDGDNAGDDIVSFYECDGTSAISEIAIRVASSTFAEPNFPETCAGACYADIPDEELQGNDDERREIRDLQEYPFDYSRHFSPAGGRNYVFLTWGFSTAQGDLGVLTLSQINARADESRADTAVIDATGTLQVKICTARISNQDADVIYGVAPAANGDVKGFRIAYQSTGDPFSVGDYILTPTLNPLFQGGQVSGPLGIGCAENYLLTQQTGGDDSVKLWDMTANTVRTVATGTVGLQHSQALNSEANIGAFVDGTTIKIFRTDTLVVFENRTLPTYTGTPCGMEISGTGANRYLWWAACGATGTIARYDLSTPFDNQTFNPGADTDGDGIPNASDEDIDNDGLPNQSDPDIDGDGLCNAGTAPTAAEAANPGTGVPCTGSDTDNDADGLGNTVDPAPGGTPSGAGTGSGSGTSSDGQGLFGVSRRNGILYSGGMILGALFIGFAITTTKRRRTGRDE